MKVKLVLPALVEAKGPYWRPIKYSLFPPLGLATLAGYLHPDDVEIVDEHVEELDWDDEPDLVAIEVYITSAYRAYEIADHYRKKGVYVAMGGIHPTSVPEEAICHADSVFIGPGEDTWPEFLRDLKQHRTKQFYYSMKRTLEGQPAIRRDLIKRELYLTPNSIIASRGCPHKCDFCYKESFFKGGKSYYVRRVDEVLKEISGLHGRHLFFLDDHLFGNSAYAESLFEGMYGMGRLWQAAATVESVLRPGLLEKAVKSGLRSLFVGFETLSSNNLKDHAKHQNLRNDYERAVKKLRENGVMVSGSFIFGMDNDYANVFDTTVEWAIRNGIELATFHIMTPYPGTKLYQKMLEHNRIITGDYNLYNARNVVFKPANMKKEELESGFDRAYSQFYSWSSIFRSASVKGSFPEKLRHIAYSGGWKKFEPLWDRIIKMKMVKGMRPLLEQVLEGYTVKGTEGTAKALPGFERIL